MVHFVGAGSGAQDLITVRGKHLLEQADVIIYAGSLVNPLLLGYAREQVPIYNSARMTLEQVIDVIREHRSEEIVRLHTGDPSLFGAIREQMDVLEREQIPYDVTPGVSSFLAAAAALGEEYTLPDVSQTVILTRMEGRTRVPEREQLSRLAAHGASMVIFLSAALSEEVQEALLRGAYSEDTPAAIVCRVSWPEERLVRCSVGTLHESMKREAISKTALILVGEFLRQQEVPARSCLYDPAFSTGYRQAEDSSKMEMIRIACFSAQGERLGRTLGMGSVTRFPGACSLADWTQAGFEDAQALIFIGACGIAVRAIAPFVKSKRHDPAVVAMDETGAYLIPILSGHMGGANHLAEELAAWTGGHAILTTATDRRGTFAVDSWAQESGFGIVNPEAVKTFSAAVLDGEEIVLSIRTPDVPGEPARPAQPSHPPQSSQSSQPSQSSQLSHPPHPSHPSQPERTLRLVPKTIAVGAGCRKGTDPEHLERCFLAFCQENGIEPASVACVATIDLKKEESALRRLSARQKIPLFTFSAEELMQIEGDFTGSEFVLKTTGTDNVCERAAIAAGLRMEGRELPAVHEHNSEADVPAGRSMRDPAGSSVESRGGRTTARLIVGKTVFEGVTFAAARVRTVRSWAWDDSKKLNLG